MQWQKRLVLGSVLLFGKKESGVTVRNLCPNCQMNKNCLEIGTRNGDSYPCDLSLFLCTYGFIDLWSPDAEEVNPFPREDYCAPFVMYAFATCMAKCLFSVNDDSLKNVRMNESAFAADSKALARVND